MDHVSWVRPKVAMFLFRQESQIKGNTGQQTVRNYHELTSVTIMSVQLVPMGPLPHEQSNLSQAYAPPPR